MLEIFHQAPIFFIDGVLAGWHYLKISRDLSFTGQNGLIQVPGKVRTLCQLIVGDCFLWRTSLGKEVNVGREWVGEEGECLSRKTEIKSKMHPFLRSGDDITFGQVRGTFYIMRPTGLKGQQVWKWAVWFNVVLQPVFTQSWSYICYPLSFLAALGFGSLMHSTAEEGTWFSVWEHL